MIPRNIIKGRVYHKPKGRSYAYGCNPAAIKRAGRKGFDGIDLDIRINKDDNAWCCHQPNPTRRDAWTDRAKRVNDRTPITRMSDADCRRMHFGIEPMMSAARAAQLCADAGLIPCFEAKGMDKRFESVAWWTEFRKSMGGVTPIIMSLPGAGGVGARKLKAAHDAGLLTMWLWRPTPSGRRIPAFVDLVKSHKGKGGIYRKSKRPISPAVKPRPKRKKKPVAHPAPNPAYLGPAFRSSSGDNKPIHRIVIHSTVSPCEPGGARNIARYFRSQRAGGSAHYVIDPAEVVQTVYDNVVAWHAPPNRHSIGNEMCEYPSLKPGRWLKKNQRDMLRRTAKLTAQQCLAFGVPVKFLSPTALRRGERGITTHHNVSRAFHQSSHWDPGLWPRFWFMRMVRKYVKEMS